MLLALLLAQVTPVQPMPKGTGLPPAADDQAPVVLAVVQRMLDGLAKNDPIASIAETHPQGGAAVVVERSNGARDFRRQTWTEFAAGMKPGRPVYRETMTDPAVEVDGDIAMVWSPYLFTIDGKLQHCGTNHFDLIREVGGWKVLNVTWSQRTTGCEAQ